MKRAAELVAAPLRALERAAVGWGIGLAALVVVTVAFWPAFEGASGISDAIDRLPSGLVQAFGLEDFGTPAGFLRGNLYEFILPLLLSIGAVAAANGVTAADEDAGRLETYLAQPVSRRQAFGGRAVAIAAWVALETLFLLIVQLGSDAIFGLSIETTRIVQTVVLCGLLALLAAALALAVAGWMARPSLVLAIAISLVVAGYLVAALFPLSDVLAPLARFSPWDWALGSDPLTQGAEPWRYLALAVPALVLAGIGAIGFDRRDVRAP
jgi:ABC-2 type transport system permease protein